MGDPRLNGAGFPVQRAQEAFINWPASFIKLNNSIGSLEAAACTRVLANIEIWGSLASRQIPCRSQAHGIDVEAETNPEAVTPSNGHRSIILAMYGPSLPG